MCGKKKPSQANNHMARFHFVSLTFFFRVGSVTDRFVPFSSLVSENMYQQQLPHDRLFSFFFVCIPHDVTLREDNKGHNEKKRRAALRFCQCVAVSDVLLSSICRFYYSKESLVGTEQSEFMLLSLLINATWFV